MEFKFGRASRLVRKSEFSAVFGGRNTRVSDRYFTILAIERTDQNGDAGGGKSSEARLGLAISKKRAKRAVDRNRIKRVIRESFRANVKTISGFDIVVMNRDAAVSTSSADLSDSLYRLWQKLPVQAQAGGARAKGNTRPLRKQKKQANHGQQQQHRQQGKGLKKENKVRSENGAHQDNGMSSGSSK